MGAFDNLDLPAVDPATPLDQVIGMMTREGMPFATKQEEIGGITHTVFANQPPSLREAFMMFLGHGDKEFMVYGDDRITFTETVSRASMLAQALVDDYGVKKGDRVALAMRNYPEWVLSFMAITAAGGIAVLMNAWWKEEELAWAMQDCGAHLAITDGERAKRMLPAAEKDEFQIIVARDAFEPHERLHDFASLYEGKKPLTWPTVELAPDDPAIMLYTSGSTGFPKGALSTHRAFISVLMNWVTIALSLKMLGRLNADPDFQPVMLVAVPFFHVTGLLPVLFVSATVGRKVVLMHKWDVEEAFKLIEREGVTAFTGVPTMSFEMASSPLREKYDLSTLVDIGGGGAARPPEHVRLIRKAFKESNPGIGYGLTETNSMTAVLSGDEYVDRPTSVGKPTPPMIHVTIRDADGNEVPQGERGEVCIKSATNFREYWNKPDATKAAFFPDGWFRSGDIGYLDEEGYLYVVDRLKDIIIRGGENISTLEVEAILHAHPSVEDVMVFGLPDPRLGEIVGAVVVTSDPNLSAEDLIKDAAQHLASFKLPEQLWLTTEPLPLIASGKIDRKGIRTHYQEIWQSA
ncbi:class I adenylate-forming enzyme family protein [Kordiimonas marina]|uniref:class I adenylate-forming enzyme family protein n=1 Tax=Kordiimonas marina TaxID=2872312 RepID=UPI001FF1DBB1|nr:class I adenylate-forming enzyme family protein [Kordiimonas marina]MCJ9429088.1 acyl--CoA ligase [Kordiimonas marina]